MTEETKKELTGYPSIDKPWLKYYSEEELNIEIPSCSIYENMYRHANGNSKEIAIEYMGRKITYKELFFNIDKVARALKAVGVCKGDVVSVCLPNIPEALYLFYAINRIGAVANMLDVRCGGPTLKKAIMDAESKVLFYLDSIVDKLVDIKKNTLVEIVVAVTPIDSFPRLAQFIIRRKRKELRQNIPKEVISWTRFIEKCHGYSENVDAVVDENIPAVIAYTGGTTGEPKGVIGNNKNVNAVAEMEFRVGFNQREHDSILCMAPPWTYYGLCNSVHVPLCMGLKVILLPKFEADELADLVLKLQPNHVVTVPSALNAFFQSKYDKSDFSCLHSLIVGADKLDESLEKDMNDFLYNHSCEIKVSKGYGMTEVMAAAAYSRLNANEIGSVGIPYPLNTITAFRETDGGFEECKIGEQGEIAILGPTVMKSYFGKFKQENNEILKVHDDGTTWAHTGDIGYIGEDGRVYIVGRLKRMFVRMGFKVFPATIEHCILENEDVQMAAVVPIKEIAHGYCIKAYIVRKNPNADSEKIKKEIINKLSEELYEYELPDVYEFVDELPLTGMGKVDYRALEEL